MKTNQIFAITALLLSSLAISHAAQFFDSGNLVVLQVGNGKRITHKCGHCHLFGSIYDKWQFGERLAIPSTGSSAWSTVARLHLKDS